MAYWDDSYRFFEPSRPRAARGGIKAQTRRGAFGASWWSRRWIAVLEGFQLGARLTRGRSYARRGQVLEIAIEKGLVRSRVQGSRQEPYVVTIKVKVLAAASWRKLAAAFSREARFAAMLLAGEMPEDVEQAFERAGLSLFPSRREDLVTDCSCPDWSNPCKHIAAVYYLLGEEFDRDPFLVVTLRGMPREEFASLLGKPERTPADADPPESEPPAPPPLALRAEPRAFWEGGEPPADLFGEVGVPAAPAALAKRLGRFPFWRGGSGLLEWLEPVYSVASSRGLEVFLGSLRSRPGTADDAAADAESARPPAALRRDGARGRGAEGP
jgi:uncharacterized Zn finger protein